MNKTNFTGKNALLVSHKTTRELFKSASFYCLIGCIIRNAKQAEWRCLKLI